MQQAAETGAQKIELETDATMVVQAATTTELDGWTGAPLVD